MLVILSNLIVGMQDLMRVLLTDNASIFAAILSACSIFVGLGIMCQIIPIVGQSPEGISRHKEKLITCFLLAALMLGSGKGLQAVGIANFAVATGVKNSISSLLTATAGLEKIAADRDATEESREAARAIMETCIKMPQTLATGEANPAFDECRGRVLATIKDGKLQKAGAELNENSLLEDMAKAIGSPFSAIGDAIMALPRIILEAIKVAVALAEMLAYGLALVILPVAASWSLIDYSLLKTWFAGFWGVAMYGWALTIIAGSFEVINAKIGGSVPRFTAEIVLGIIAPFMAAGLAGKGAEGIYASLSRGTEIAARAAASGVKGG